MRKIVKILVMAVLLLSVSSLWKGAGASASTEPVINVKLVEFLGYKYSVGIKVKGKYQLDRNPELLVEGKDYYIKKEGAEVCFYEGTEKQTCQEVFSLKPVTADSFLYVEGRPYNGAFKFQLEAVEEWNDEYVRPINSVYLEDYVKGVVPEEMWADWPAEALKAQATASRSFGAFRKNLVDGVLNQVYGGYFWSPQFDTAGEYTDAVAATDATRGEYVTYKGTLIEGLFSASNGGYSESSGTRWTAYPYYPAQTDEFDGINEDVQWAVSYHKTQIDTTALDLKNPDSWWSQVKEKDTELVENIKTTLLTDYDKNDVKITAIEGFTFNELTVGKRYTKADLSLEFYDKNNKDDNGNLILQKQVLKDIAPSKIKTDLFDDKIKNNYVKSVVEKDGVVTISGAGMGHGVGMSQYGAYNRAMDGQTHSQILGFYYPGTSITTSYTELADRSSLNAELRGWVFAGSDRYYYDPETGAAYPGWKKLDDTWYFFEADGKAKTGWVRYAGYWYYMDSEGQMATGWVRDAGKWYYLNADGTMKTGWYKENGVWYYLEPAGDMKIGWKKVGTTWYYFKSSGAMATGWVKSGTKWYYMDQSGAMETGWIDVAGKWYYLYSDGSMAYNTTIGGYKLGSDGAWIQ